MGEVVARASGLASVLALAVRPAGLAEVSVESDAYQIVVEPGITIAAARTTSRDIKRQASNYQPG